MIQLADLFSVPEMGLICNVADYFERNHIDYHPEILFRDVRVSFLISMHYECYVIIISTYTFYTAELN